MEDPPHPTSKDISNVTSVTQETISNCMALSMDERVSDIVDLIGEIEELLGLANDKRVREERLRVLRKRSVSQSIYPKMTVEFSKEVNEYCDYLRSKRDILRNIFQCNREFFSAVSDRMDSMAESLMSDRESRMTAVGRYIRKRSAVYPVHAGKRKRNNRLPGSALEILWNFLQSHKKHPYPTLQQKEYLARQTRLTVTQIRNWFTNTRKRKLAQSTDSDEDYSLESDQGEYYDTYSLHRGRGKKRVLDLDKTSKLLRVDTEHEDDVESDEGKWIQYRNQPSASSLGFNVTTTAPIDLSMMSMQEKEYYLNNQIGVECKKCASDEDKNVGAVGGLHS